MPEPEHRRFRIRGPLAAGVPARGRSAWWTLAATLMLASRAAPAAGQEAQTIAIRCDAESGGDPTLCALAIGGGRDLMADVAVLGGPGAEVPGQGSALGRRIGGSPRFAGWIRGGGHSVVVPDLAGGTPGEESSFVPALHGGLGLGLFDGFSVLPTVGGVLSLDVVGQGSLLFLPEDRGFDGRSEVFSLGARVGILRESFTLPGLTLSVARRLSGSVRLGSSAAGDAAQVVVDPSVTSVRATVAKDLFAFGVLFGVGWDDLSADMTATVGDGTGGSVTVASDLDASRTLFFMGLSRQIGVLSWISAELGWAPGFDPVEMGSASSPDRGSTLFGSLALVLKI
jgi:hypothetical protein